MDQGTMLYTIGHSNMSQEELLRILSARGIGAVADVRSTPWSRRVPWFNQDRIQEVLEERGIRYVHLGKELGGRPDREDLFDENGRADYERMALEPGFRRGIEKVEELAREGPDQGEVALMCTEHDHLTCHRTLLVARELSSRRNRVVHITRDGRQERHCEAMSRLMRIWELPVPGQTGVTLAGGMELAIRRQAGRVAHRRTPR